MGRDGEARMLRQHRPSPEDAMLQEARHKGRMLHDPTAVTDPEKARSERESRTEVTRGLGKGERELLPNSSNTSV